MKLATGKPELTFLEEGAMCRSERRSAENGVTEGGIITPSARLHASTPLSPIQSVPTFAQEGYLEGEFSGT